MLSHPDSPQRIVRLTPLDKVLARVDALVQPVAARRIELASALDRALAGDIVIAAPIPRSALALRDGWALRSELTSDAGPYSPAPVPGVQRIDVGEALPGDADAVASLDAVVFRDGEALALAPVASGDGVLPAGGDFSPGAVLRCGRRIGRMAIAALAHAGIGEVEVREPRVRIARARVRTDPVIDNAVLSIADAVRSFGAVAVIGNGNHPLEHALNDQTVDAVIIVGGTGCGRDDAAIATLASHGKVEVHGIGLTPGESSGFAMIGPRPMLAFPGRLDAALAAWHMLGRHTLSRLAGNAEPPLLRTAKLTHKVTSQVGMAELVPVRCEGGSTAPIASGYVPLCAMAQANGWLFIKAESEGYPAGHEVMIRPWP
jgi:molybdopterin molybdotransferase